MKKSGFTLAELMITLGIIAVAAVIAAPAISDMMPQKDKMKVIKYETIINNATDELLNDPTLYHPAKYTGIVIDESGNRTLSENFNSDRVGMNTCSGLACTQLPERFYGSSSEKFKYSGVNKYANLVSDKLGLKSGRYVDGSVWKFETTYKDGSEAEGVEPDITIRISIDINGTEHGKNCNFPLSIYDKEGCHQPDIFLFEVDRDGNVRGNDPLTRAYLANPLNMHDKENDQNVARHELINYFQPPRH